MASIRRRRTRAEPMPDPSVATGFRLLPNATATHPATSTAYLLRGSFGSPIPVQSVGLYRTGSLIARTNYWCPPGAETMMHNLGVIQYAFAFGVWEIVGAL
jgi:hypothetical protein